MHLSIAVSLAAVLVCIFHQVHSFPSGAPSQACDTLSPDPQRHGADPTPIPCPGPSCPYELVLLDRTEPTYTCGETIRLRLRSSGEFTFRGFFIQSRVTTDGFSPDAPFFGEFIDPQDDWQIRPCDGSNAGATHTSNDDKTSVDLTWQAPGRGEPAPPVTFWLTIVEVLITYHIQIPSLLLEPIAASCQPFQVQFQSSVFSAQEGDGEISVCAVLLEPSPEELTAFVFATDTTINSAIEGEDFDILVNILSFPANQGDSVSCARVAILDDTDVEGTEVFRLALVGARITPDETTVSILDNDDPITRVEFVDDSLSFEETVGLALVCGRLLDSPTTDGFVSLSSFDVTATEGEDYTIINGNLPFSAGVPAGAVECFIIEIIDDGMNELDETFRLIMTTNMGFTDEILVTIIGNSPINVPVVGFELLAYRVNEGETVEACVVILRGESRETFSLQMVSISGTASAIGTVGVDVEQILTAVDFEGRSVAGDRECVDIVAIQDFFDEPINEEFFFLALFPIESQSTALNIDPDTMLAIVTVVDRVVEPPSAQVAFTVPIVAVGEGIGRHQACIVVLSSSPLSEAVAVSIVSRDGTALSFNSTTSPPDPPDYIAVESTITLPLGTPDGTTECISVSIVDDEVLENDETFYLDLFSGSPRVLGVLDGFETQRVTIVDNEPRVSLFGVETTIIRAYEGQSILYLCLHLISNGPLLQDVFFGIIGENRTAIEFEDFVTYNVPPIQFLAGSRGGKYLCVVIQILDDFVAERQEEFGISFISSDESVAVIEGHSSITVLIEDDDVLYVELYPPFVEVAENENEVFVCVLVTRATGPVVNDLKLRFGTQDLDAIAMEDYVTVQRDLTFAAGTIEGDMQCIAVPILDNTRPDGTRAFLVRIVSFTPFIRALPFPKLVIIRDDDRAQVEFQQREYSVPENGGPAVVCVTLLTVRPLNASAVVSVSTEDGSAIGSGDDYATLTTILTFVEGDQNSTTLCVSVQIVNDNTAETDQTFSVVLTSLTPDVITVADGGRVATVIIIDDEDVGLPQVQFISPEVAVSENAVDQPEACVILIGGPLFVNEAVLNINSFPGSALAGLDYRPVEASITLPPFAPNGTIVCVTFTIIDDAELEEREYFRFRLTSQSANAITLKEGNDVLIVHILDDESPLPVVGFQVTESAVNESVSIKFTCIEIISGGPLPHDAEILFYTQDGSAEAPDDYTAVSSTLTFAEGADGSQPSDAQCEGVAIIDDTLLEETESLVLKIAPVDENRILVDESRSEKVLYILDDDAVYVGFSRTLFTISEDLGSELGLLVCVTVEDVAFPFQLTTEAVDGTATEILDYRVNNGPLQFVVAGGDQTQCAYIQVVPDDLVEFTEYFTLELRSDNPAIVVTTPSATIRIKDNRDGQI